MVTELDTPALAKKYKALQAEIVAGINREHGLGIHPSDAFLLARLSIDAAGRLSAEQQQSIARHRRASVFRFCLTPYFLDRESTVV